ncbi:hypothetical protein K437DRAFT_274273 [Tilletiaria anomala UBC 951]|uniref:F-box domain-containing protein n=1 Tax=Tilletiaria anomala (strain ATCC 24038 / CBS 436.72 / UBC 951) TaxID=1037660 RepID=A0A066W3F8_TILAU|nr:uncharacterized protein K437DRAFT_274273 [Tilletiaria anomala UBC 951]KDN45300.1 hypothetical protein K437DRAFT_274273 [Tilletiaria anomala UBC 951]
MERAHVTSCANVLASKRLPHELLLPIFDLVASESLTATLALCCLNRFWQNEYERRVYRSVLLQRQSEVQLVRRALRSRPERGQHIRDLSLIHISLGRREDQFESDSEITHASAVDADALLQLTPNVRRLQLSHCYFFGWERGLYNTKQLEEAHLHGCRDQGCLKALINKEDKMLEDIAMKDASARGSHTNPSSKEMLRLKYGDQLPMKRIELCFYTGAMLAELVQLSGLTHIVLTRVYSRRQIAGLPNVRLLPRSSVQMLLSSPRIKRLIIQDETKMLSRIISELNGIEDPRLRFRALVSRQTLEARFGSADTLHPAQSIGNRYEDWVTRAQLWRDAFLFGEEEEFKQAAQEVPYSGGLLVGHPATPWQDQRGDYVGATLETFTGVLAFDLMINGPPNPGPAEVEAEPLLISMPGFEG